MRPSNLFISRFSHDYFVFSPTKHTGQPRFSSLVEVTAKVTRAVEKVSAEIQVQISVNKSDSGAPCFGASDKKVEREVVESNGSSSVEDNVEKGMVTRVEQELSVKTRNQGKGDKIDFGFSSLRPKYTRLNGSSEVSKDIRRTKMLGEFSSMSESSKHSRSHESDDRMDSGYSSSGPKSKILDREVDINLRSVMEESTGKKAAKSNNRSVRNKVGSVERRDFGSSVASARSKGKNIEKQMMKRKGVDVVSKEIDGLSTEVKSGRMEVDTKDERSKKTKAGSPEAMLRVALDMCSKRGDVMGALNAYDLAKREHIKIGQYNYAILLYLCSSAAAGVIQPAKSGTGSRSLSMVDGCKNFPENSDKTEIIISNCPSCVEDNYDSSSSFGKVNLSKFSNRSMETRFQTLDELIQSINGVARCSNFNSVASERESIGIKVGQEVKEYALKRGFEMYEKMIIEQVPMNEAILTSLARMAMSIGDGDMAFNMVKKMMELGINPRLRSYGPALSVFCGKGDVEKAFVVEEHMLAHGVYPEEPELEALLRVSVESGRSDKVYYLLHKLRTSVRKVSCSTADLIEKWFSSKAASRSGKRKWDPKLIQKAIENGGGGWHGQGWLGKGNWRLVRTFVGTDGLCKCCGEKLVTIDLDPAETDNFAESVARIAKQREKNLSFEKFQKWLDYYGPFEAVVDGANVGLFSQRRFKPSKVNAIVNGIRQVLPSKRWPLVVLHNRRLTEDKMNERINRALVEKWKNADAIYATPTGSNDDWYWLYAAIKFKCLIVTNDEMRDHLFQLLGNDFFPKWKERHQVRFSFSDVGPAFHMPSPCSVLIQESEEGHWHVPIASERETEEERTWLCITRNQSGKASQQSIAADEDSGTEAQPKVQMAHHESRDSLRRSPEELYGNLRDALLSSLFSERVGVLAQIEAAEKLGGCVVDFQI